MKVVISVCYGGFGLSKRALKRYYELKGIDVFFYVEDYKTKMFTRIGPDNIGTHFLEFTFTKDFGPSFVNPEYVQHQEQSAEYKEVWNAHVSARDIKRDDPHLVQVVEELGVEANTRFSDLKVVEIPEGVDWRIDDYDGSESIAEGRTWS